MALNQFLSKLMTPIDVIGYLKSSVYLFWGTALLLGLDTAGNQALASSEANVPGSSSYQAADLLEPQPVQPATPAFSDAADFSSETPSLDPEDLEADLGTIRYLPRPFPPFQRQRPPILELVIRSSTFSSSNIFAQEDGQGDLVFLNSIMLQAMPRLSDSTRLMATAEGGLIRYLDEGDANSNFLNFNVGIQQRLNGKMFGQMGWGHSQLYRNGDGDRLLFSNAARLTWGRQDVLAERLRLDSFYESKLAFASPERQTQWANTLGTRLRYDVTENLQGAIDYQLILRDYLRRDRFDVQNQFGAGLFYSPTRNLLISGYLSYLLGSSSEDSVSLNNFSAGIGINWNLPLF